ncbi:unnamed protein product [[Candida] boidinii]|nr:unnamed protein product [[Candida] boidinii]
MILASSSTLSNGNGNGSGNNVSSNSELSLRDKLNKIGTNLEFSSIMMMPSFSINDDERETRDMINSFNNLGNKFGLLLEAISSELKQYD